MKNKTLLLCLVSILLCVAFRGAAQQYHLDTVLLSGKPVSASGLALDALVKCIETCIVDSRRPVNQSQVKGKFDLLNKELNTKVFRQIDAVVGLSLSLETPAVNFTLYECTIINENTRKRVVEKLGLLPPAGEIFKTIAPLFCLWRVKNQKVYLLTYGSYPKAESARINALFDCMMNTVR